MDRFVAHCVATAVITAALAAVPTVLAQPSRAAERAARIAATATSTSAAATAAPASAPATTSDRPAPPISILPDGLAETTADAVRNKGAVCADAYQVGPTVYARWHGEIVFSLKQFYSPSCHARYSYGYPWLQFRDQHVSYDVGLAVLDVNRDELDGGAQYMDGIGGPDYWSAPATVTPGTCTRANLHLFLPDDETDTYTQEFCL